MFRLFIFGIFETVEKEQAEKIKKRYYNYKTIIFLGTDLFV